VPSTASSNDSAKEKKSVDLSRLVIEYGGAGTGENVGAEGVVDVEAVYRDFKCDAQGSTSKGFQIIVAPSPPPPPPPPNTFMALSTTPPPPPPPPPLSLVLFVTTVRVYWESQEVVRTWLSD